MREREEELRAEVNALEERRRAAEDAALRQEEELRGDVGLAEEMRREVESIRRAIDEKEAALAAAEVRIGGPIASSPLKTVTVN